MVLGYFPSGPVLSFGWKRSKRKYPPPFLISVSVVVSGSPRLPVALPALPTRGPVVPLEDLLRIIPQAISCLLLTGFRALSSKPDVSFV